MNEIAILELNNDLVLKLEERNKLERQIFKLLTPQKHYYKINNSLSLSQGGADTLRLAFGLIEHTTHEIKEYSPRHNTMPDEKHFMVEANTEIYRNGVLVGTGFGQSYTTDSSINNREDGHALYMITLKARKRAYVRAVLQSTGLRGLFTQDLEDMDPKLLAKAEVVKDADKRLTKQDKQSIYGAYKRVKQISTMKTADTMLLKTLIHDYGTTIGKDWETIDDITADKFLGFKQYMIEQIKGGQNG